MGARGWELGGAWNWGTGRTEWKEGNGRGKMGGGNGGKGKDGMGKELRDGRREI